MAHKKSTGAGARQGGNVKGKRLGIKVSDGSSVSTGRILVRQRGRTYIPGKNVSMGKDFTLHAKVSGQVHFKNKTRARKIVEVIPHEAQ